MHSDSADLRTILLNAMPQIKQSNMPGFICKSIWNMPESFYKGLCDISWEKNNECDKAWTRLVNI